MNKSYSKILLALSLFILSCQNNEITLGSKLENKEFNKRVLAPTISFIPSTNIKINDIEYIIGVNSDQEISYVSTTNSNFRVDGLTINSKLGDIENDINQVKHIPGWGYYIEVNSEWYAGFDFQMKPNRGSKIKWFFKYHFSN